jgi:arsenate reductase
MKIYHNPRCSKSRQTLQLIEAAGIAPDVVEYLKTPPSAPEFDRVLTLLGIQPNELMRKKEAVYQDLGLSDRTLSRDETIQIMIDNPQLIERPIVVRGDRAVIGRPPENVKELLE